MVNLDKGCIWALCTEVPIFCSDLLEQVIMRDVMTFHPEEADEV